MSDPEVIVNNSMYCPECGGSLEYDSAIYDHDEGACLLANCPKCGAEIKEIYAMVYKRSEVHIPKRGK